MMTQFQETLERNFPGAMLDHDYVGRTSALLRPLGFTAENSIACVATCRDEICRPVRQLIQEEWGEAFNFSSLAGMLTLGRTGFGAFHAHAPRIHERRRHIYYAMPHLAIGADGTLGLASRYGISEATTACGALFALAADFGELVDCTPEFDQNDVEQSLLKMRLVKSLNESPPRDPADLAKLAELAIREDLEAAIVASVDPTEVDYGVFTGIQIHGPGRRDYVFPVESYVVIDGQRTTSIPKPLRPNPVSG